MSSQHSYRPSDQQTWKRSKHSWNKAKEDIRRARQATFDNSRMQDPDFYSPPPDPVTHLTQLQYEARAISNSQAASRAMQDFHARAPPPALPAPARPPQPQPPTSYSQVSARAPFESYHRSHPPKFIPAPSYEEWKNKERLKPAGRSKNEQLGSAAESWGSDYQMRKGMFQPEDSPPSRNASPFRVASIFTLEPTIDGSDAVFGATIPTSTSTPISATPMALDPLSHFGRPPWHQAIPDETDASSPNARLQDDRRAVHGIPDRANPPPPTPYDTFGPVRGIPRG